jgi:hypothetical protein
MAAACHDVEGLCPCQAELIVNWKDKMLGYWTLNKKYTKFRW